MEEISTSMIEENNEVAREDAARRSMRQVSEKMRQDNYPDGLLRVFARLHGWLMQRVSEKRERHEEN